MMKKLLVPVALFFSMAIAVSCGLNNDRLLDRYENAVKEKDDQTITVVAEKLEKSRLTYAQQERFKSLMELYKASLVPSSVRLNGSIFSQEGKPYPVVMNLFFTKSDLGDAFMNVSGWYYYLSQGPDRIIRLYGALYSNNEMMLHSEMGTETFKGSFINYSNYSGTWKMDKNGKVKTLRFSLSYGGEVVESHAPVAPAVDYSQKSQVESSSDNAVSAAPAKVIDDSKVVEKVNRFERVAKKFMDIQKSENRFDMDLYGEAMELESDILDVISDCSDELQSRFQDLSSTFSRAALFGSR